MVGTWFILLPFFDRRLAAFFFLLFQEMRYGMARVFVTRCFNFSTAFTVDWLIHLWEQDLSKILVLDEKSNSQLFSSANIFNSQTWISTRILRVCKREFRALMAVFQLGQNIRALHPSCLPWRLSCPIWCPSCPPLRPSCSPLCPSCPYLMCVVVN